MLSFYFSDSSFFPFSYSSPRLAIDFFFELLISFMKLPLGGTEAHVS